MAHLKFCSSPGEKYVFLILWWTVYLTICIYSSASFPSLTVIKFHLRSISVRAATWQLFALFANTPGSHVYYPATCLPRLLWASIIRLQASVYSAASVSPCRKPEWQSKSNTLDFYYPAAPLWPPKLRAVLLLLPHPSLFVSVKAEATFCHLAHSSAANLHDEPSSCVFIYTVICTVIDESVCDTAVPNCDSFFLVHVTQL